jgi:DNA mismatch repair ATPase MutS
MYDDISEDEARERVRIARKYLDLRKRPELEIDEKTWSDLSADRLFIEMDKTRSQPGRSLLYASLRTPSKDAGVFERRQAERADIVADPKGATKARKIFSKLGALRGICYFEYLHLVSCTDEGKSPWFYMALAGASVLCYLSPFLLGKASALLIVAAAMATLYVYIRFKKRVVSESECIHYTARLIAAAGKLGALPFQAFDKEREKLAELAKGLEPTRRHCAFFYRSNNPGGDFIDSILEFFKMAFLLEAINYRRARTDLVSRKAEITETFELLGKLDASLAMAEFLEERQGLCAVSARERGIAAVGMAHPYLKNPVPNGIDLSLRGAIITGTNMSGKSTFLRTIGLNLILAQASGYAQAEAFSTAPLYPESAINDVDDILGGKSRYLGEAERLLRFVTLCDAQTPAIFLIDEILSGTNSMERSQAAVQILSYLARHGALVVAATHDLDIARGLEGAYDNFHFDDEVTEKGLCFDYRVKPGVVSKRNALRLLAYLGYPKEITEKFEIN